MLLSAWTMRTAFAVLCLCGVNLHAASFPGPAVDNKSLLGDLLKEDQDWGTGLQQSGRIGRSGDSRFSDPRYGLPRLRGQPLGDFPQAAGGGGREA